jgi:hypothetical protein
VERESTNASYARARWLKSGATVVDALDAHRGGSQLIAQQHPSASAPTPMSHTTLARGARALLSNRVDPTSLASDSRNTQRAALCRSFVDARH